MSWASVSSGLNTISRGAALGSAGFNCMITFTNANPSTREKIAATLEGIYLAAEAGNHFLSHSEAPPKVKLLGKGVTLVCSLAQLGARALANKEKMGKKWGNLNAACTLAAGISMFAFRVGDIAEIAKTLSTCTLTIQRYDQVIEWTNLGKNLGLVAGIVIKIPVIPQLVQKVYLKYQNRNNMSISSSTATGPTIQSEQSSSTSETVFTEFDSKERAEQSSSNQLTEEEILQQMRKLFEYKAKLDTLDHIPALIADDNRLRHTCSLTGKKIRFILIPHLTLAQRIGDIRNLKFEKAAILTHIKMNPMKSPPGWPVNLLPLPIKMEHFTVDRSRQEDINLALTEIITELQTQYMADISKD